MFGYPAKRKSLTEQESVLKIICISRVKNKQIAEIFIYLIKVNVFMSYRKLFIILIGFLIVQLSMFGQFKNFGTTAKQKPEGKYLFAAYGYFDAIRESGGGLQYQVMPQITIDLAVYSIRKSPRLIAQWDYYDFHGVGLSIKPKFLIYKLGHWYVCPNISFEQLSHGKTWVEYGQGDDGIILKLQDTKGKGTTVGVNFGRKININYVFIEPFVGFGLTSFKGNVTTYDVGGNAYYNPNITIPYSEKYSQDFLQLNVGIKLGVAFIKNKRQIRINELFDSIYIPRNNQLDSFFALHGFENKAVRKAYNRYKGLNRKALIIYRRNYFNTPKLIIKMNQSLQKIDSLINLSN